VTGVRLLLVLALLNLLILVSDGLFNAIRVLLEGP
jgi:hypothetical protein